MSEPQDAEDMLREMLRLGDCGLTYRSAVEAVLGLVELLRKENEQLHTTHDRLRRDRAEVLNVKTADGLTSSEWLMRTAKAEAEVKRLRAENAALKENASATLYHESLRLKRENAELRRHAERLLGDAKQLDWFRRREPLVAELQAAYLSSKGAHAEVECLIGWIAANPQPGAGT